MKKGHRTTLTKANNTNDTLRTTIPTLFVQQTGLKKGDELIWIVDRDTSGYFLRAYPHHVKEKKEVEQ